MAGTFELFVDDDSQIRFRLVMPDGHVLAVSGQFTDKRAAAAAIEEVRECAGTGLIQDVVPPRPGVVRASPQHPRYAVHRAPRRLNNLGAA